MLKLALAFLAAALVFGLLGFGELVGVFDGGAKVLFFAAIALFIAAMLGRMSEKHADRLVRWKLPD